MGRSRKGETRNRDEVVSKVKGKRKVIYVDDRDYHSTSPEAKRHVPVKKTRKSHKNGGGKVRYVYLSDDSESDHEEVVVKKRSTHKVLRKARDVSETEGDGSERYEYIEKRKKRQVVVEYDSESTAQSDDSVDDELVLKKRKKRVRCGNKQYRSEAEELDRNRELFGERQRVKRHPRSKKANVEGSSFEVTTRRSVLRPNNRFGAVTSIDPDTYYRSNIGGAMHKLSSIGFSAAHLDAIKQTPFWLLFEAIYKKETDTFNKKCHKYEGDIRKIVDMFDVDEKKFLIGGQMMRFTRTDAQLIFGISCGDVPIVLKKDGYTHPTWLKRCFADRLIDRKTKFIMYRSLIYRKIKEATARQDDISVIDCARLVHCYLLVSIFAPLQNGSMTWQVACFVEDFPNMCTFDWSSFVIGVLKAQLDSSRTMRCGGCSILLHYWLCEHTQIIKRESEVSFPRFLNWDLTELHKVLPSCELGRLTKVSNEPLIIRDNEIASLLELKIFRSSKKVAQSGGVEEADEAGPSNTADFDDDCPSQNVHGFDCDDDLGTAQTNDVVGFDQESLNAYNMSTEKATNEGVSCDEEILDDYTVSIEEESEKALHSNFQKMPEDDGMPEFSLGLTQPLDSIVEGDSVRADNVCEFVVKPSDGPECTVPTMKDHSTTQLRSPADTIKESRMKDLSSQNRSLKLQVDQLIKERDAEAILGGQLQKENSALRSINTDLLCKIASFEEGPTATQLYENQAVMENLEYVEKMAILKKENQDMMKLVADLTQKLMDRVSPVKNPSCVGVSRFKCKEVPVMNLDEADATIRTVIRELSDTMKSVGKEEAVTTTTPTNKEAIEKEESSQPIGSFDICSVEYNNPENLGGLNTLIQLVSTPKQIVCYKPKGDDAVEEEITPVGKGKGIESSTGKHSMYGRVRGRGDRKKRDVSPQLDTGEMVAIHEGYTSADIARDMKLLKANKKKPLNMKIAAVRNTDSDVREEITFFYVTKGIDHVLYRGVQPLAEVSVSHMLRLLHQERLSSALIDDWSDLVLKRYTPISPIAKASMVFSSTSWDLIHKYAKTPNRWLQTLIDERFVEALDKEVLLFPILAGGEDSTIRNLGDHWTLLRLQMSTNEWTFYNSSAPRVGTVDQHLRQSLVVVRYVNNKLREMLKKVRPSHTFLLKKLTAPTSLKCMRQSPMSLDCGVVVCNNVEMFLIGEDLKTGELTHNDAAIYRAKMAAWFMED